MQHLQGRKHPVPVSRPFTLASGFPVHDHLKRQQKLLLAYLPNNLAKKEHDSGGKASGCTAHICPCVLNISCTYGSADNAASVRQKSKNLYPCIHCFSSREPSFIPAGSFDPSSDTAVFFCRFFDEEWKAFCAYSPSSCSLRSTRS